MNLEEIIKLLEENGTEDNIKSSKRFDIRFKKAYGVKLPILRKIAKQTGKNHKLAQELWEYNAHETRLLATMIDEPEQVTNQQLNEWVSSFDSWDIVDQACLNLFDKVPQAIENIFIWYKAEEEFIKRTAFSLIAIIAVHNKKAPASIFDKYYPLIIEASTDNRNFVKKSISWALRSIGKRDKQSNKKALKCAYELQKLDNKTSKWIARDVIRELESEKVQNKIK